jgi:hypothetical protein
MYVFSLLLNPSEGEEMLTNSYYYKHYYPTWNHYRPERHWPNWQITYPMASHLLYWKCSTPTVHQLPITSMA